MKLHLAKHTMQKNFVCKICGSAFYASYQLVRHQREVHSDKEYECKLCGKIFKNRTHLNSHIKSVHINEKIHGCPICGMMFQRNDNLRQHCRNVHKDVRTYRNFLILKTWPRFACWVNPKFSYLTIKSPKSLKDQKRKT